MTTLQKTYRLLLEPHSTDPDDRRREFILNVILFGLATISCVAVLASIANLIHHRVTNGYSSFIITAVFTALVFGAWRLNKAGHYLIISYLLLALLGINAFSLLLEWGVRLPIALLSFGLSVVAAGVLLTARAAIRINLIAIVLFVIIGRAQITHRLHPNSSWIDHPLLFGDVLGYGIIFAIIGLITWLANREIDQSLSRARASEADLALERDSLEIKVVARTKELEQSQLLRTLELRRFAEFGRVTANLLHEVTNPLTAASLNLQQIEGNESQLVSQASRNVQQIERYVVAARKQLQNQSSPIKFNVKTELKQVLQIMQPLAQSNQLTIKLSQIDSFWLFGDTVKFDQIISNLLVNAIDAYEGIDRASDSRTIHLTTSFAKGSKNYVDVTVTDRGKGIKPDQLERIFDLFYSTKAASGRGMGIGLDMVKRYAEDDFSGSILVSSTKKQGTTFTARLKLVKADKK